MQLDKKRYIRGLKTRRRDEAANGRRNEMARRQKDEETRRRGEERTKTQEGKETGRRGDEKTRRQEDKRTRRQGSEKTSEQGGKKNEGTRPREYKVFQASWQTCLKQQDSEERERRKAEPNES